MTHANPRILVVEDESAHATLIQRAFEDLDPGAVLRFEYCLAGARRALEEMEPDLVVVDYVLPDGFGVELLTDKTGVPELPIVVMTSHGDERTVVEVLKAGAFDYVIKSPESLAHIPHVAMRSLREWNHIVERRRAEKLAARLGQILEVSSNEIYFVDADDLTFVQASRGALLNLGYSLEELREISLLEILPRLDPALLNPLRTDPGKMITLESYHRRRDGTQYPVEVHLQAPPFGDEAVILAVVVDCTEKRENEEKQARLEEQLHRAKRLETIGTLAGGVAHDFNNLLAPILGYSEMALADLEPTSRAYSDLEHVSKAARRAKELVHQLLVFSRQSEPEHRSVDVGEMLVEALDLIKTSLVKGITVQLTGPPSPIRILADETQILMMIFNLCTNAAQAMADCGGTIDVRFQVVELDVGAIPRLSAGSFVLISVEDTGKGMSRETLERIFDPFFTTKGVMDGTGLGLSVVHGIVTAQGGVIQASSEPGEGSRFEIYLPLTDPEASQADPDLPRLARGHRPR